MNYSKHCMATHATNFAEMKVEKAAPTILFGKKGG